MSTTRNASRKSRTPNNRKRRASLPTPGYTWIPARGSASDDSALEAAIILSGCLLGMAVILVICWVF